MYVHFSENKRQGKIMRLFYILSETSEVWTILDQAKSLH